MKLRPNRRRNFSTRERKGQAEARQGHRFGNWSAQQRHRRPLGVQREEGRHRHLLKLFRHRVKIDNETYLIVTEEDILGVVE